MAPITENCRICYKKLQTHSKTITCSLCNLPSHIICLNQYSPEDIEYAKNITNHWTCPACLKEQFPFYEIEKQPELYSILTDATAALYTNLDELILNPFELGMEEDEHDDIDPDGNYYDCQENSIPTARYMHIDAINRIIQPNKDSEPLSIFHINIRSLKKNYTNLTSILPDHEFSLIALTETWLKQHNMDLFPIEGYQVEHSISNIKTGGGISVYIKDSIHYKIREDLNCSDDSLEMLWIEMDNSKKHKKNIIAGCIYRKPGSDLNIFNDTLATTLQTIVREN